MDKYVHVFTNSNDKSIKERESSGGLINNPKQYIKLPNASVNRCIQDMHHTENNQSQCLQVEPLQHPNVTHQHASHAPHLPIYEHSPKVMAAIELFQNTTPATSASPFLQPPEVQLNFLIGGNPYIKYRTGYVENELGVMVHLAKTFTVLYNGIPINGLISNNVINIKKLNTMCRVRNKNTIVAEFSTPTICFFRSLNIPAFKQEFHQLPHPKVYSHDYDYSIWKSHIVGFQTPVQQHLALHDCLQDIPHDGTLEYHKIAVVPQRSFVRQAFIHTSPCTARFDTTPSPFKVCVIGAITALTSPKPLQEALSMMHQEGTPVELHVLTNFCNIDLNPPPRSHQHPYKIVVKHLEKQQYYQYLSTMHAAVNTWNHPVCIYSNSNKLLDCIAVGLPMVVPQSVHYQTVVGSQYPFFVRPGPDAALVQQLYTHLSAIHQTPYHYNIDIRQYNTRVLTNWVSQIYTIVG